MKPAIINNRNYLFNNLIFYRYKLFDGSTHITEPYFILDAAYGGSGKPCLNDSDCLNADLPNGKETCRASKSCYLPARARVDILRSSCTAVGSDSKFFTKRHSQIQINVSSSSLSSGIIALIVILTIFCLLSFSFIGLLFYRKIINKSSFSKLF
jgi:hypothetical protein